MLDAGAHVFVWLGSALGSYRDCNALRAAALDYASRLTAGRFPLPDLRIVTQVLLRCLNPLCFL